MTKKPLKVYIHGTIGRTQEIEQLFKKLGVENPLEYKFGDPWIIYYVNQNNEIAFTEPGTDLYYVITNQKKFCHASSKPHSLSSALTPRGNKRFSCCA